MVCLDLSLLFHLERKVPKETKVLEDLQAHLAESVMLQVMGSLKVLVNQESR